MVKLSQQKSWVARASFARLAGDQTPCAGRVPWAWILGRTHRHIAVSSPYTQAGPSPGQVPRLVDPGGPWGHGCSRSSGPIARPVPMCVWLIYFLLMRKGREGGGVGRARDSHMRDLGRYAAAFQIAGFGPRLVRRFASAFCFSCMLPTSTDLRAYNARGTLASAAQAVRVATRRHCGTDDKNDKATRH